ncbi:MAG: type IV pilus secretin PilQ, partial [Sulfuricella sp.]|nr:type IV pilus secretin PilQ [Sulfuricella sp.]
ASDSFSRSLGARLGFNDLAGTGQSLGGNNRALVGGSLASSGYFTNQIETQTKFNTDALNVSLPAKSSAGTAGVLSLILFQSNATRFLNLELSALQADGKGKIISNPRVLTSDQTEAVIEDGTDIPYLQASSSGATSVSFKKAVLSLKVKPQITPDDNIIMDLKVNKDSRGENTIAGPAINTKQITTQVLVENGGTVVIGGIFNQEEASTVAKVPLLGDIPVLGFMFRKTDKRDEKRELLVFVTPRILKESLNLK